MSRSITAPLAAVGGLLAGLSLARAARAWRLAGRVAVVTGGSRGLGLCLARELGRRGARVALLARDAEELERASQDLASRGATAIAIPCDVTRAEDIARSTDDVLQRFGRIDLLFNNAGTITVGPLEHMTPEDFEAALALHVMAPLRMTLAVLPGMRARGEGRIVNIASLGGLAAVPHMASYTASKFGLVGLSDALRAELAASGVRVTTVCPGLMRTGSHVHAQFKGQQEREFRAFTTVLAIPGLSIDAADAAERIVQAARHGDPRVDLSGPTHLARWLQAVAPSLVARGQEAVARLLPAPRPDRGTERRPGSAVQYATSRRVTARLDAAALANNARRSAVRG
jgi:short-subunit dehydrogenase